MSRSIFFLGNGRNTLLFGLDGENGGILVPRVVTNTETTRCGAWPELHLEPLQTAAQATRSEIGVSLGVCTPRPLLCWRDKVSEWAGHFTDEVAVDILGAKCL